MLGGALAVISAFIGWENHPRVVRDLSHPHTWVLHEVSHSIGLLAGFVGPAVLVLGMTELWLASKLRGGSLWAGWATLLAALTTLGLSCAEFTELLLKRRRFLDHSRRLNPIHYPPLVHAVGAGLWLSVIASVMVLAGSSFYLRRAYVTWRW